MAWIELFQFPDECEVVLLVLNCFSSQRYRGCGVACAELFQFPERSRL